MIVPRKRMILNNYNKISQNQYEFRVRAITTATQLFPRKCLMNIELVFKNYPRHITTYTSDTDDTKYYVIAYACNATQFINVYQSWISAK